MGLFILLILGIAAFFYIRRKIYLHINPRLCDRDYRKYYASLDRQEKKLANLRAKRQNTPCIFTPDFSYSQFQQCVRRAQKHIRRITKVDVNGSSIHAYVESNSGISSWEFYLDFNDWGRVTGRHWIDVYGNFDSQIQERFGELIQDEIEKMR